MTCARLLVAACYLALVGTLFGAGASRADTLTRFLPDLAASDFAEGADGFGAVDPETGSAPILRGGETLGHVFLTSDFVGTTGYSGKPIHVVAAIDPDARIMAAYLVKHSEPIVLIGIPDRKIRALTEGYRGLDLKAETEAGGAARDLDIISGATVTIIVIDDSIVRAGIKLARRLSLGGLAPEIAAPRRKIDRSGGVVSDWATLAGDGSVRRLSLDIGQVNRAFERSGDETAIARPERGAPDDVFIQMTAAMVSIPEIGRTLLGDAEYANLTDWLAEGEEAILVTGRGPYSFKGSGYVRGGVFDRIQLIQGDRSVRFFDRDHKRLGRLAPDDAPAFTELDIFRIPAEAEFDPAAPWRLQLLVQRATGAVSKAFVTTDLSYRPPERFIEPAPVAHAAVEDEAAAKTALWRRVWRDKRVEIGGLLAMLAALTMIFFFQKQITRRAGAFFWLRMGFLTVTLVFLGWMTNAQLSVVNLLALVGAMRTGFSWDAFLLDPLVFIQWFAIAAALLFWGRGAYCGWLCPFGALQELSNRLARAVRLPQFEPPWGLHERLWPLKYVIFLGLLAVSLTSLPRAETLAEIEPFKTAIILKFAREWPFVVFALAMLAIGLFVERFYCRYVCPLGAALAIPARIRMFDWLKRYRDCGNPCQTCANECPVQAIHPTGEINPNECVNCLHCQVLYQSDAKCPVVIRQIRRRARAVGDAAAPPPPSKKPQALETL